MKAALKQHAPIRAGAIAVTGAKGGVGKSNLVLNLAVALGRWGRRVLVVDGDLGLANIDVLLGLAPQRNIEQLVRGQATLEELLIEGPQGIRILPAASGVPDLARLDGGARSQLLGALSASAGLADDVLVDTGAGLGETTLSLQLAASRVLVVTTPEPTSLVDAYATLKVLWSADASKPVDLVVNAADGDAEAERTYSQIARASGHFLGRQPGWLGPIYLDPKVGQSVRRQRPLMELYPASPAARCYERIALKLASAATAAFTPDDFWRQLLETTDMAEPAH